MGSRTARDDQAANGELDDLAVLVQRARSYCDQPLVGLRPRRSNVDHFALDVQLVSRPHRPRPSELVEASADDAAGRPEVALDEELHGDGGGVPSAGREAAED